MISEISHFQKEISHFQKEISEISECQPRPSRLVHGQDQALRRVARVDEGLPVRQLPRQVRQEAKETGNALDGDSALELTNEQLRLRRVVGLLLDPATESAISVHGCGDVRGVRVRNRLLELPALISKCEWEIERKTAGRISIR